MRRFVAAFLVLIFSLISVPVFADVEDFYFSDFTADYYLTRDEDGISHLKVKERLTAEFPSYNQNKGIRRLIPFTNQDGKNVVLPRLDESDIKITRNGSPEPIWAINREGDHYAVETGTDDYVTDTQVYTFEYEFEKVATDFGTYQELYWDANGNGWSQSFDKVTARVHFDDSLKNIWTGESWCYVGKYGVNNQSRCKTTKLDDGVEFSAQQLSAGENLTFALKLKPGVFKIPEPEESYLAFVVLGLVALLCLVLVIRAVKKYQETAALVKEYKGIFTAPEYQPNPNYSLAEMAEIYLGKKKDVKVGILLNMIVQKKIEIQKQAETGLLSKNKWSLVVKDLSSLRREEEIILEILNGGDDVKVGDVIEVKNRTSTPKLVSLGKNFDNKILRDIKNAGLVKDGYELGNAGSLNIITGVVSSLIMAILVAIGGAYVLLAYVFEILGDIAFESGKILAGESVCFVSIAGIVFVTSYVLFLLGSRTKIIGRHTLRGLKASKYMEGLKLYISMAEAERLKMLQSVEGADTSAEGIVKLYEKLLPYAAVFGLEKSWMSEMEEYCRVQDLEQPDYLSAGITASMLSRSMHTAASSVSNSGRTIAGGGSYSSSSSGSGGGGFSGGGGGGGGGGGR